jgi:NADH:ubiquinone oxidoreductase subunit 6 (subunit J)
MVLQIILLSGLVLFSVLAILLRDLIKSAISLALASLCLGIIFFQMKAPYAGVFEISVVAGLITVLFILTIALTKAEGEVRESKAALIIFPLFFVAFLALDILVMKGLMAKVPALASTPEPGGLTFGDVLWKQRTFDLVGQVLVILAGVFAVLALFRKRNKDE